MLCDYFLPFFLLLLLFFFFVCLFSVDSLDFAMTSCRISTEKKKTVVEGVKSYFTATFCSVCMTVSHKPIPQKSSGKEGGEKKKKKKGQTRMGGGGECNISSGLFLWLHQFLLSSCLCLLNAEDPWRANCDCLVVECR